MTSEEMEKLDEEMAAMRFVDQPGQWVDTTPEEVKQQQAEELKELEVKYVEPSNYFPEEIRRKFFPETVKHSGFDAPTIGKVVPDGVKRKKNPDGTATLIYPKDEEEKHSGFDAPVYGERYPKGTKIRKNPNGTVTLIPPKNEKETLKHSGFEAPTIGKVVPEGTKWVDNPDETVTPVYPSDVGDAEKE